MSRRAVLGIDAAWTDRHPSGVALAVEEPDGWRLAAVAASYADFAVQAGATELRENGNRPDAEALLAAARRLAGGPISLVAVDMPLARHPIVGRRPSDLAISRAYGARHAATHSPSALRPGAIADEVRAGFEILGYRLLTVGTTPCHAVAGGLIEVYPHPALIEFAGAPRRLPYKFGRRGQYWPEASQAERRARILAEWGRIAAVLEARIGGSGRAIARFAPERATGADWKAQEDRIDAIVCAAVGLCVLEGRATAYGDGDSAIWVPCPDHP